MSYRHSNHNKPPDKPGIPTREPQFPVIESSSGSQPSMDVDFDAIFSQLPSDWRIQPKMHLPLHLEGNCPSCLAFTQHVVKNTRGGGYSQFIALQKDHWREVLQNDFEKAFDDGWYNA